MRVWSAATVAAVSPLPAAAAPGQLITIEPDDHAAGTALTSVNPHVTLWTLEDDYERVPQFTVTAARGDSAVQDLLPTGSLVFAHFDIPFFKDIRRLEADFNGTTSTVSIAFAGGSPFDPEVGRLEVYGESGQLLDVDVSAPTAHRA